jgi:general secretion pathway protein A
MYNAFYGFKEKPFKLVPNPEYLFLSKSHEEALAHLNYAISQGDGFVEITGEVGTGKTTLCRAFLESLGEDCVAAYIFNPRLGPKQLIKTINDELGIQYDADNTKDLIDKLNAFLIRKKAERKKVILLIDEAQNLSKTVLEQLRLLSNLETSKEKLLQIILVGQPELAEMIDSHDLRQLGQRISLRYQIMPLGAGECRDYIQYRLNVASQKGSTLFDPSACQQIFRYSKGIPRLINIACDRALLTAFSLNAHKVSGRIAKMALTEVAHRGHASSIALMDGKKALGAFLVLCVVVVGLLYHQQLGDRLSAWFNGAPGATSPAEPAPQASNKTALPPEPQPAAAAAAEPPPAARPAEPQIPPETLAGVLKTMENRASRYSALNTVLAVWGMTVEHKPYLDGLDDDATFFTLYAKTGGFLLHRFEGEVETLQRISMPAVLELRTSLKNPPLYLALTAAEGDRLILSVPGDRAPLAVTENELWQNWTGVAFIPWKDFLALTGTIPGSASPESILALKVLLKESGFPNLPMNKEYGQATQKAVEQLQAKYGIGVDGVVGPLTKIIVYREQKKFDVPRLENTK